MTLPATLTVSINFANGPAYGIPLTLDDPAKGILGTNVLADNASLVIDYSTSTTNIAIRRGRNLLQDTYDAGQATVRILDPEGNFNPQNTASPIYGYLQPARKLRISANYGGTDYYLFSGYTAEYRYTYPQGQETAYVTITAFDAFKIFNTSAITTVTGAVAGETTGTRIGRILDTINWPSSMRDIDTGQTTCQADPASSRAALTALKTVELTEYGAFYCDPAGNAVFQSRDFTTASIAGTPTVFNQTGTGIPYANVKFAFDDKLVYNQANIQRTGGTTQTASDATSIDTYFLHSYTQQNLLMETDAVALDFAKAYVASRKDTSIRIDALTLDLMTANYSAGVTAALNLDYFDPVTITNTTDSGSTITKTLQVQGVSHDITPNSWITTFITMEPIIDGFILDSTLYGILGTSVFSYQKEQIMAAGWPTKANYATGDVLSATNMNDLSGTVNLINPSAKGDLYAGSAANTYTKLAVGANATVLTADSTTATGLKWATPAGGSGMTLLSTTTLSGTSVNIGVASGYINLFVVIYGITTNNNYELQFRINSIAGVPYYMNAQRSFSATTVPDPADTFFVFNPGGVAALNSSANNTYTALIENYASGSMYKTVTTNSALTDNVSVKSQVNMQGVIFDNTAMASITIGTTTGTPTFSAGTVLIYGVK